MIGRKAIEIMISERSHSPMKVRRVSLEQLLKQLENSRMSSDLGKDILSTYDILKGYPFDRNEAASRIILNNAKHPGVLASLSTGSRQHPVLSDSGTIPANEIRSRLNLQFQELCREAASVLGYALEEV